MMTRLKCGAAVAALMTSQALPVLAQDEAAQPLYELQPGTVVILVPETGLTYQLPVTVAVEVCPDIDEAYLVSDFEGTTGGGSEIRETVSAEYDFESLGGDGDNNAEPVAEAADPASTDGAVEEDDGAVSPDDGTVDAGTDADAGGDTDDDVGVDTGSDAGTDGGSEDDAGADAGGDVDAGTDGAAAGTDAGGGADAGGGTADATGG